MYFLLDYTGLIAGRFGRTRRFANQFPVRTPRPPGISTPAVDSGGGTCYKWTETFQKVEELTVERIAARIKHMAGYVVVLAKWLVLGALIGAVGGFVGSLFHIGVNYATSERLRYPDRKSVV